MAEAKKRNHATENVPPQVQAAIEQAQRGSPGVPKTVDPMLAKAEATKKKLGELLSGERESPNEFAAYLVQKLRETIGQGRVAGQKVSQLRLELKETEEEIFRLEGAADRLLIDLEQWDRPLASDVPPAEDPQDKESTNGKPDQDAS